MFKSLKSLFAGRTTPEPDPPAAPTPERGRVTSAATDTETGTERLDSEEDRRQALWALEQMHRRGLIPEAEYRARRQRLEGAGGDRS